MGEYARDDIMRRFGVDIGDDDGPSLRHRKPEFVCRFCRKLLRNGVPSRMAHERAVHPEKLAALAAKEQAR